MLLLFEMIHYELMIQDQYEVVLQKKPLLNNTINYYQDQLYIQLYIQHVYKHSKIKFILIEKNFIFKIHTPNRSLYVVLSFFLAFLIGGSSSSLPGTSCSSLSLISSLGISNACTSSSSSIISC